MKTIGVGFLGLGVVGQGVWQQLLLKTSLWERKLGVRIEPRIAAVRDIKRKRDIKIPDHQLTSDTEAVVTSPHVDLVIELMGGVEQARDLTLLAFRNGKSVISANKALICEHGQELLAAASEAGVHYLYEASVAGGIPIIKVIQEAFVGNHILSVQGILNGTSNYILSRMEFEGLSYQEALLEAKALGYVEQDESLDLDGVDAAHKLIILAYLCFHQWFSIDSIQIEGIRNISLQDIQTAAKLGYRIKLVATLSEMQDQQIICSVRPSLVPLNNNLASVEGVFNGVCINGDIVGTSFLIGRGAGREPTTSAVLSDVVDYCRNEWDRRIINGKHFTLAPSELVRQPYYLKMEVRDEKGVLADITSILSRHNISISTIEQVLQSKEALASIMMTTHECCEHDIQLACQSIQSNPYLQKSITVFPIL